MLKLNIRLRNLKSKKSTKRKTKAVKMIATLKGVIDEKAFNKIILDVNGVGYELFASGTTINQAKQVGEVDKFFTHLIVREDLMQLIGFKTREEKALFLNLLEVNGVGTKAALTILSNMSLEDVVTALATGDSLAISRVKGIGKKTAEKIILELQDKVQKSYQISAADLNELKKSTNIKINENKNADIVLSKNEQVAADGLTNLGLTIKEATKLIESLRDGAEHSAEELIKMALRSL
jgi:Holliday junction DNA helicase RuvA